MSVLDTNQHTWPGPEAGPEEPLDLLFQMSVAASLLASFGGQNVDTTEWPMRILAAHDALCGALSNHLPEDIVVVEAARTAHDILVEGMDWANRGVFHLCLVNARNAYALLMNTTVSRAWPFSTRLPQAEWNAND